MSLTYVLHLYILSQGPMQSIEEWGFKIVLDKAKFANEKQVFYNTAFSSCTTAIFDNLNEVLEKQNKIGFNWRILFPEDSAKILFDLGLLDADDKVYKNYEELKAVSSMKAKAIEARNLNSKEFSEFIHSTK
jgi:hypothetical protein